MAETIRKTLGVPVHVNSGCRRDKHNKAVGGLKSSKHLKGLAADLSCSKGAAVMMVNFPTSITAFYTNGEYTSTVAESANLSGRYAHDR